MCEVTISKGVKPFMSQNMTVTCLRSPSNLVPLGENLLGDTLWEILPGSSPASHQRKVLCGWARREWICCGRSHRRTGNLEDWVLALWADALYLSPASTAEFLAFRILKLAFRAFQVLLSSSPRFFSGGKGNFRQDRNRRSKVALVSRASKSILESSRSDLVSSRAFWISRSGEVEILPWPG